MKTRILAVLSLGLFLSACSIDQIQTKIEAAITATNEVIVANRKTMEKACTAGQIAHDQFVAQVTAGTINVSEKDQMDEEAVYEAGLDLCENLPNDLPSLLKDIPLIQTYVAKISALLKKG